MLSTDQHVVARVLPLVPEPRGEARVEMVVRDRLRVVCEADAARQESNGVLPILSPAAKLLVEPLGIDEEASRERGIPSREVDVRPDVTRLLLAAEMILPPRPQDLCPECVGGRYGGVVPEDGVVVRGAGVGGG